MSKLPVRFGSVLVWRLSDSAQDSLSVDGRVAMGMRRCISVVGKIMGFTRRGVSFGTGCVGGCLVERETHFASFFCVAASLLVRIMILISLCVFI